MTGYLLLRYQCAPCGVFHTVIKRPDGSKTKRWTCVCGKASLPTQTCTGVTTAPKFGSSTTHRLVRGKFPDQREYPQPLNGWDNYRRLQ